MDILGYHITRHKVENNAAVVQQPVNNATSMMLYNTQMRTITSDYANDFAQVDALVTEAFNRDIYPVDERGHRIRGIKPHVWDVLCNPNTNFGFKDFLGNAMRGYISNPTVEILMWHNAANPTPGYTTLSDLCGMTYLPEGSRYNVLNKKLYRVADMNGEMKIVTPDDVASLSYSIDPLTMTSVSPGSASHQMAQILDSMAMQLRAYFNNGATPQLLITIHAPTTEEFTTIKQSFENANRGPANSYGTVYQHVIDNGINGNGTPRIEVEVVGSAGENMAIKDITDFAQTQINANLGVSPMIYGDSDATAYANQTVINDKFNRRVIARLDSFLSNLTFELNRITGGIGFSFGYDYEETEFADKELMQAQTMQAKSTVFAQMINLGVSSDRAALACGMSEWTGLMAHPPVAATPASSPSPSANAVPLVESPKPKTGSTATVRERQPDPHEQIRRILTSMAKAHLSRKTSNDLPDEDQKYESQLLAELQQIADNGGVTVARQLAQQIKGQTISTGYEISGAPLQALMQRAENVISSYSDYLDDQMDSDDMSQSDIESSIATGLIAGRIASIVTGEGKYAFQAGQQDNASNIQSQVADQGITIKKIWTTTSGSPCEFCEAMNGKEAGVSEAFVGTGLIQGSDGGTLALDPDYDDGTTPDAHPNCQCVFSWSVDGGDDDAE